MKSAAAAPGPATSYLCTPEAHGNAPSPLPSSRAGVRRGPQAEGRGPGRPPRDGEGRKRLRKREKRGEGKKNNEREGKLSENSQQLPMFGCLTVNCPLHHTYTRSRAPQILGENLNITPGTPFKFSHLLSKCFWLRVPPWSDPGGEWGRLLARLGGTPEAPLQLRHNAGGGPAYERGIQGFIDQG